MNKKDSKINDLLKNLGEPIGKYHEWEIPKKYPFPVYRKQLGSLIKVYKLDSYKTKIEKEEVYKKVADDYFKSEIANAKK